MPLANNFVKPGEAREGFVPVRVLFCQNCTLAQLGETVDPMRLYSTYLYTTSGSQTMLRHFDRLTKDIISENGLGTLVEAGSNDGLFLRFAKEKGFGPVVVGVDPAANLIGSNRADGIVEFPNFFGTHVTKDILFNVKSVDTILARHCFCHQEWKPFMEAVTILAHPKTLVCIEVPYALDLLRRTELDSIYSEHTSYLTIKSVAELLKDYPWHIHGVLKYGVHGGAVLVMLRHNDIGIVPHLSADEMLSEENVTRDSWRQFAFRANEKIQKLRDLVSDLRGQKKIVSMFGASAKGSVIINACQFSKEDISFVTDNSPLKPGRWVPGTDIPVIEEGQMLSEHPDVAICAAWNYRAEILEKMSKYRQRGGKFVFPTDTGWETV